MMKMSKYDLKKKKKKINSLKEMKEKTLFLVKESSEKYNLCLKDIESLKIYKGKFIEIITEYKKIYDRYNNLIKDNEELLVKY